MSQPRHASLLITLALAAGAPACGDDSPTAHELDASQTSHDASVGADASPALSDAGASDAGPAPDAGPALVAPITSALVRATTPDVSNLSALGSSNRAFAFDLYHQLAGEHADENLLFSPYSISSALAMTYAGARGTTESEIKTALHFDLPEPALHEAFNAADLALASRGQGAAGADGTPFRLSVNNALWTQKNPAYPPVPAFLDTLAVNYGAGLFLLDFMDDPEGSRGQINDWVSAKTQMLIPELLPARSITSDTRFVITNTVYFNASWQSKFDPTRTFDATFTKLDGSMVSASTMHDERSLRYIDGDGYQAIALPYASSDLSFVAILPDEGKHPTVEAALSGPWFDTLIAGLASQYIELSLPKLDYAAQATLNDDLATLGMKAAFNVADFSGISAEPLKISTVVHKAVIKLIEGGTIAAAATGVVGTTTSAHPTTLPLAFDRPYFTAIYDEPTGTLLFLGRVLDPTGK